MRPIRDSMVNLLVPTHLTPPSIHNCRRRDGQLSPVKKISFDRKEVYRSMMITQIAGLILTVLCAVGEGQEYERTTTVHPHPYAFAFTAGRYPGQVDRTRVEYGDDNGIIRGLYTYVDPRQEIRAVEYVADKDGFHPILNIPAAVDTPAVAAAKSRHIKLFNQIAENHGIVVPQDTLSVARAKQKHALLFARISQEHARIAGELEAAKAEVERAELYRKQNESA